MPGSSFSPRRITESIERNDTSFDTRIADTTNNRIDASGEYSFNIGRHRFIQNNTFIRSIDDTTKLSDMDTKMQVTASAGDELIFGAREIVRYVPNYELLWGVACWAESELTEGQHMAAEFSEVAGDNGYRVHYEGTPSGDPIRITLEQYQGSTSPVDTYDVNVKKAREMGFNHTKPHVNRALLNWYGAGLWRHTFSFPTRDPETGNIDKQVNREVGKTANDDDVATNRINLRVQARVWCDAGADPVTVNVCSIGALIRGAANQRNREKSAVLWNIGGSISQYPTDNVGDAVAARIDPERDEVAVDAAPPIFEPSGSGVEMELQMYAVHKDHPDLAVNFADPDDDGTDEGPSPAPNGRGATDVMQYTRAVSSIPTESDIRADGSNGLVPAMRELTTTLGSSGTGGGTGQTSGGEQGSVKRLVFPEDVVVLLPRTNPGGNTTAGEILWLKTLFDQDW